ncbi:hypothetical protein [Flavobacterium sp.]|uniref:hypothetical protein n=1 Tax=Flavobacterium sp. TaxID=239 RepID=UPI00286AF0F4|nr:hypothetical protein [Flavobacterium sp.]
MKKEELQKIIEKFDENELKQKAIFGVFQYGGGSDESFVRANKEGLELFALELLKSAKHTEAKLNNTEKTIIPLEYNEDWIDENSDTFIEYIELIAYKQNNNYITTISNKLMSFGFGLLSIILVISVLVGLVVIFKWLF